MFEQLECDSNTESNSVPIIIEHLPYNGKQTQMNTLIGLCVCVRYSRIPIDTNGRTH